MKDKVDILMATFNGEKYLKDQIESILNQTYTNISLLISDDCSNDSTREILKKYEKNKKITIFYQSKNLGYVKNFEFLSKKATNKYVMFSDQDDIWKKDKIEKMLNYIKKDDCVLLYSDLEVTDQDLNKMYPSFIKMIGEYKKCLKYNDYNLIKTNNVVTGCSVIVKNEILKKCIPFPNNFYPHDWWIATISSQYGKLMYLDEKTTLYRQHGNNTIGLKNLNNTSNPVKYRENTINYKKNQFDICYNNIELFNEQNKDYVKMSYDYFKNLDSDSHKKKALNNIYVWKIYNNESFIKRVKMIILFNYPKIYNILFKLKNRSKK